MKTALTVDELMAPVMKNGALGHEDKLRAALESALQAAYERGRSEMTALREADRVARECEVQACHDQMRAYGEACAAADSPHMPTPVERALAATRIEAARDTLHAAIERAHGISDE